MKEKEIIELIEAIKYVNKIEEEKVVSEFKNAIFLHNQESNKEIFEETTCDEDILLEGIIEVKSLKGDMSNREPIENYLGIRNVSVKVYRTYMNMSSEITANHINILA